MRFLLVNTARTGLRPWLALGLRSAGRTAERLHEGATPKPAPVRQNHENPRESTGKDSHELDEELTTPSGPRCRAGVRAPFNDEQRNLREARRRLGMRGYDTAPSLDLPYAGLTALREGAASLRGASLTIGN